jgi:fumarylacetoacetate (FAA) hydrolase family protein
VRLFDSAFTIDHVKTAELDLSVEGADGYHLEERESVAGISRDPLDLISQVLSDHQYPDGFVLFLGTPFAPVQDRDVEGGGFTHKVGDVVRISSPRLGTLTNRMVTAREAAPWTFGIRALYREVARQQETMR